MPATFADYLRAQNSVARPRSIGYGPDAEATEARLTAVYLKLSLMAYLAERDLKKVQS